MTATTGPATAPAAAPAALTCQFCSAAPAARLLVFDQARHGRTVKLVCADCGDRDQARAAEIAASPASAWLFDLTGGLTPAQRSGLAAVFADGIEYRYPPGGCTACEDDPDGLCGDHSADLDRADRHLALARELGIELEDQ